MEIASYIKLRCSQPEGVAPLKIVMGNSSGRCLLMREVPGIENESWQTFFGEKGLWQVGIAGLTSLKKRFGPLRFHLKQSTVHDATAKY